MYINSWGFSSVATVQQVHCIESALIRGNYVTRPCISFNIGILLRVPFANISPTKNRLRLHERLAIGVDAGPNFHISDVVPVVAAYGLQPWRVRHIPSSPARDMGIVWGLDQYQFLAGSIARRYPYLLEHLQPRWFYISSAPAFIRHACDLTSLVYNPRAAQHGDHHDYDPDRGEG
jgi:hypothetical protein